jgi:hypothetical protein
MYVIVDMRFKRSFSLISISSIIIPAGIALTRSRQVQVKQVGG